MEPDQCNRVQGSVGLPVPAAAESVPVGPTGRGRYRCHANEPGERGLRPQPVRVVPGSDQHLSRGIDTDPGSSQQPRRRRRGELAQLDLKGGDLLIEGLAAPGQSPEEVSDLLCKQWLPSLRGHCDHHDHDRGRGAR